MLVLFCRMVAKWENPVARRISRGATKISWYSNFLSFRHISRTVPVPIGIGTYRKVVYRVPMRDPNQRGPVILPPRNPDPVRSPN